MKVNQQQSGQLPSVENAKAQRIKGKSDSSSSEIAGLKDAPLPSGAKVEISDTAKLMKQAADIARAVPDVRSEKVAALKKSIQNGSYQVDASKIADRLVEEHLGSDFGKNSL